MSNQIVAEPTGQWTLSEQQIADLLSVPHFKNSREARKNLSALYASYAFGFADLIGAYLSDAEPRVVADIGTGYGWLAAALAHRTKAHIIAVDNDAARLAAARQIATILGVAERIEWRLGGLPHLPLADGEADVTFCVEVLEHVGTDAEMVVDLGRVTRDALVITTPNRLFPCIQHDTRLPFCHCLPLPMRNRYAALFGRLNRQDSNLFWSPGMLLGALPEFRRVSALLQYPDAQHFRETERRMDQALDGPVTWQRLLRRQFFTAVSWLGPYAIYALPNLASTFRRIDISAAPPSCA
ncbi:MAG: hypothetical protein B7Z80_21575 [Rhodospirillales bacterium 20-64-7]|nr:MAG: hypothetical protein B7Z80_21575 [Rhodospirillales bacterium 20-64-7]HQT78985.1 class I SAM-dependent methyltransferase [Rhodopila sp.]